MGPLNLKNLVSTGLGKISPGFAPLFALYRSFRQGCRDMGEAAPRAIRFRLSVNAALGGLLTFFGALSKDWKKSIQFAQKCAVGVNKRKFVMVFGTRVARPS